MIAPLQPFDGARIVDLDSCQPYETVRAAALQVVDKTLSIHQSNVAIFNTTTGKADRVGIKLLSDDEKKSRKTIERGVRVFRSSGAEIKA